MAGRRVPLQTTGHAQQDVEQLGQALLVRVAALGLAVAAPEGRAPRQVVRQPNKQVTDAGEARGGLQRQTAHLL